MSKSKLSGELQFLICLLIMIVIMLSIAIPLKHKSQKEEVRICVNGTYGVCLVTEVRLQQHRNFGSLFYAVRYEYKVNDKNYDKFQTFNNVDHFTEAIVGMKYVVKYLEDNPKKSLIFLDKPILSEYKNIEKERERMQATSKYRKGLESAAPIESIKMRYPEYFK